jgi:hypothetical protein
MLRKKNYLSDKEVLWRLHIHIQPANTKQFCVKLTYHAWKLLAILWTTGPKGMKVSSLALSIYTQQIWCRTACLL